MHKWTRVVASVRLASDNEWWLGACCRCVTPCSLPFLVVTPNAISVVVRHEWVHMHDARRKGEIEEDENEKRRGNGVALGFMSWGKGRNNRCHGGAQKVQQSCPRHCVPHVCQIILAPRLAAPHPVHGLVEVDIV